MSNPGNRLPFQSGGTEPPEFKLEIEELQRMGRDELGTEIPDSSVSELLNICNAHIRNTANVQNATRVTEALKVIEKYEEFSETLYDFWIARAVSTDAESYVDSNLMYELEQFPITVTEQEYKKIDIFGEHLVDQLVDKDNATPFYLVLTEHHLVQISLNYQMAIDRTKAVLEDRNSNKSDDSFKQEPANNLFYNRIFDWAEKYSLPTGIHSGNETYAPLSKFVCSLMSKFPEGFQEKKAPKPTSMSMRMKRARKSLDDKKT